MSKYTAPTIASLAAAVPIDCSTSPGGASLRLEGLHLTEGYSSGHGGAVYAPALAAQDRMDIANCTVDYNEVYASYGGAVYASGGTWTISSTAFSQNIAESTVWGANTGGARSLARAERG